MRHIFKMFNFGVFDYKDAEILLNQMAQKGYAFKSTGNHLFNDVAMFEKKEKAKNYKYAVDVRCGLSENEKEIYYDFYKDLGWKNIDCHSNKLHIFVTEKNNAFPLYTDEISELENLKTAIKEDSSIVKNIIILVFAAFMSWTMLMLGTTSLRLASFTFITYFSLIAIYKIIEMINNFIFTLKYNKCIENDKPIPENKVLRELKFWSNIFNTISIIILAFVPIFGYSYEIFGSGLNASDSFSTNWEIAFLFISIISLILIIFLAFRFYLKPIKEKFRSAYFIVYFSSYYAFLLTFYLYITKYLPMCLAR